MPDQLPTLQATVQNNCHIVDARHAGDYSLCVYLLKMRELFRWERGYGLRDSLPQAELGAWISEREALWESLEEAELTPLTVDQQPFDPFDSDAVNTHLLPHGMLYSGGYGWSCRPHFVLADLVRAEQQEQYHILIAGKEWARDLNAPPGATRDGTILIRTESLRRWIWERVQEWEWHRLDNPTGRALAHYDFASDPDGSLDAMASREVETVLLHELGELFAESHLGPEWADMLSDLPRSPAELVARAVRDHLADCLSTLPRLIERDEAASLHFYFGNLSGMRKQLFPRLLSAYEDWRHTQRTGAFDRAIQTGIQHWQSVGEEILDLHQRYGADGAAHIGSMSETRAL